MWSYHLCKPKLDYNCFYRANFNFIFSLLYKTSNRAVLQQIVCQKVIVTKLNNSTLCHAVIADTKSHDDSNRAM